MTNNNPLVSVITPNYNGSRFLMRVIDSVRLQNYPVEHLIVDDCSTDNSWEQLQNFSMKYTWLRVDRLEKNLGPIEARNRAIGLAKGRFLAFLDVDDFWLPQKLQTQVQFMFENNCALSFSDYRFVTEDGHLVGRRLSGVGRVGWHIHHMTRYLGCLTIIIDREKYPEFKFPEISPAYRAEDFLAWSQVIKRCGSALRCPHDLARYAVVANSRSSVPRRAAMSVWEIYRGVEKISSIKASVYYIFYSVGVVWKRYWYRPCLPRTEIDNDFGWSLLK